MDSGKIRENVRKAYGAVARNSGCGCGCGSCGDSVSGKLGYGETELNAVPDGADLGLGCGNPTAFATLREGETVLDLGSGAGMDCFLAARAVGPSGKVIGVDMTPEMIERARENARESGHRNVEFRLGEIEYLPAGDGSVNAVISNCVINLVPDKTRVFTEAFRVLAPGGRLMVSDIVLTAPLPEWLASSKTAYSACVSGAELKDRYLGCIAAAGFVDIEVIKETPFTADLVSFSESRGCCGDSMEQLSDDVANTIRSVTVSARKPAV